MATLSGEAYNKIVSQAAAQKGLNESQVASIIGAAGISKGAVSSGSISKSQYNAGKSVLNSYSSPTTQKSVSSINNVSQPTSNYNNTVNTMNNQPTQAYSGAPNYSSNNSFGDIRPGVGGREQYKGEGVKLSSGEEIKDLGAFSGVNTDKYNVFGKKAEQIDSVEPGFLAKRNDVFAMDILKNTPKVVQENVDNIILEYIKSKDLNKEAITAGKGEEDIQNTIDAIKSRMGYIPSETDTRERDLTKQATDAFDREITDIKSQYDAEKSAFMKALAVEDRYTNFNEVNDKIQLTLEAAGKHRAENLYTGMPTDEQITEIAQGLGQDFNTTKKILEGRGFEDLEMQGEFKEKSERTFERAFEDMELNRNRTITDVETKHTRTQTALNEQIDDVKTQMDRTLAYGEKAGALSGAIRSSGYTQGLENIRQDAIKNMDRLKLRKDWDTEDTAMVKGRIIEDFETGMTRTKQDLETKMNEIKTTNGAALSQYLNEYAPSSSELTRKLNELEDTFAIKSQQAFQMYTQNLIGITDTLNYDTEKALKIEGMKQQLQQTNVKNMLADNGAALAGITYNDLTTMLQNGYISPTDYTAMSGYMKTLGMSSLQSMGVPNQQDFALYNQLLEQGASPTQALQQVISASPTRFTTTTNKNIPISIGTPVTLNGKTYNQIDEATLNSGVQNLSTNESYKTGTVLQRGECGEFVNDWLETVGVQMPGDENLITNTREEKKAIKNSDTAKPGSVAIITSKAHPTNGHVAIVMRDNGNGTVHIKESNRNGDKTIHERDIAKSDIYGYFDPTITPPTQNIVNDANAPLYKKYVEKGTIPSASVLKGLGMTSKQFVNAASSYDFNSKATEEQLQQTREIYDLLIELENSPGKEGAVGFSAQSFVPGFLPGIEKNDRGIIKGSPAATFEAKFNTFKDTQVLPNLDKLKGAMSDNDIKFIRNTATSLSLDMSEKEFNKKMLDMKNKLEEKLGINLASTTQNNSGNKNLRGL